MPIETCMGTAYYMHEIVAWLLFCLIIGFVSGFGIYKEFFCKSSNLETED